jgi:hypothetical protein
MHIADEDVAGVLCKADLGCCIFSLRNPPVNGGGRHGQIQIEMRAICVEWLSMKRKTSLSVYD